MKAYRAAIGVLALQALIPVLGHPINDNSLKANHLQGDDGSLVNDMLYIEVIESEQVVVYVNQFGVPISTSTKIEIESVLHSTAPFVTILPTHGPSITVPGIVHTAEAGPATQAPAPAPVTTAILSGPPTAILSPDNAADVAPPLSPAPQGSGNAGGYGFAYSPYSANGNCKSAQQVATDFTSIADIGQYSVVRIYGTDCNQVATVTQAAKAHGLKLFAGVFDLNKLNTEVATIVAAAGGDWGIFDTISVGNELVNSGTASPSVVIAALGSARQQLRAAGYKGPVVIVDTLVSSRAHPELCNASDYCAVNCHPFFDGSITAAGAGNFLAAQIPTLRNVLSDKNQRIVITETGWPWKGTANGAAVPSPANQATALASIKKAFVSDCQNVVLFSGFNDPWKQSIAANHYADQFWGFLGNAPSG